MDIAKQFFRLIEWTRIKMSLMLSVKTVFPKPMEIWWVSLGHNIGVEANGKNVNFGRPALIMNVFNHDSILIIPLTTKVKENRFMLPIPSTDVEYSALNVSQIRSISTKRLLKRKSQISATDFRPLLTTVPQLLFTKNTPPVGISSESTSVETNGSETSDEVTSDPPNEE